MPHEIQIMEHFSHNDSQEAIVVDRFCFLVMMIAIVLLVPFIAFRLYASMPPPTPMLGQYQ
jgi:tellurite resistance protein TehA-like permease